jgi:sec-independent protein translocase protein TatA
MGQLSLPHLILLIIILLIFFGPSRLPQLGQSLGKAIKGFKEGLNEINADAKDVGPQQQLNNQQQAANQNQNAEVKKENS